MGWFLSQNKKRKGKSKRTKSAGRGVGPRPWDPQRTILGLKVLGVFALVVAVGAAWHFGNGWLRAYAAREHAAGIEPADVVLEDAPSWMNLPTKQDLRRRVALAVDAGPAISPNPLDGKSLQEAARRLAGSPWVERVGQVRRVAGGQVLVRADYREPVAVVQALDGYHLVERGGVRLPALYDRHQLDELNMPVLVGVQAAPPTKGHVWPGDDVQAGLDLVHVLAGEPYMSEVRAIDVSGRDSRERLRLVLVTAEGEVHWGLPPGQEQALEPDTLVKLDRLRQLVEQRGSIDAGGQVVDIHGPVVQISSPLQPSHTATSTYTFGRSAR